MFAQKFLPLISRRILSSLPSHQISMLSRITFFNIQKRPCLFEQLTVPFSSQAQNHSSVEPSPQTNENQIIEPLSKKKSAPKKRKTAKKRALSIKDEIIDEEKVSKILKTKTRYLHQSYTIYANVLLRVISTCQDYLKLGRDKRMIIRDDSRLYYVKQELDRLTMLEEEVLINYLEAYREIIYRTKTRKEEPDTVTSSKEDAKKDKKNVSRFVIDNTKTTVRNYLMIHQEYGQMLHRLIMEFLNKDNLDYKDYLAQKRCNKNIKQYSKYRSKAEDRTVLALTIQLEKTRKHYQNIFIKKPPKPPTKENVRKS